MAPTTVLAEQHYKTFKKLFKDLNVPIELCISENKKIVRGKHKLIIGTHAVLYDQKVPEIGLLIIDEQHRFGVGQRDKLAQLTKISIRLF
jgi:transcription-repair coupling factor (superfamily II helicase)